MHLLLQRVVNVFAMHLEHGAQRSGSASTGLAVAFGRFFLQRRQGIAHQLVGFFNHLRRHLGLGSARGLAGSGRSGGRLRGSSGQATRGAQFVCPHRHRWQGCSSILCGSGRLRHGRLESLPHHQQLGTRGIEQRREPGFHTRPAGITRQLLGLFLPACDIGAQQFERCLRIAPGLGREHFDALCQQHSGLALHLNPVLQVFDDLHAVGQLYLEQGQRLARQRGTSLGGIPLPGQGICNIELGGRQQGLGFFSPFGRNGFLPLGATDFVQAFAHGTGRALVAPAQLLEHLLQLLWRWLSGQPVADARSALARCGGRKSATSQRIERMRLMGFGRGRIHFRCVGHFAAGKKWKHGSNGLRRHPRRRAQCRARATAPSARQGNKRAIFTGLGQRL